ncbi:MAG: hypothetical protein FJ218_06225 [Ignavibacteria bacterium]|nr:hypothetical protein [Ignavibacteria bacterium]
MQLPHKENAYVPFEKLTDYLLSPLHSVGKHKMRVLRKVGFDEANIEKLENALLEIAKKETITQTLQTNYGMKYVIDGILNSPNGTTIKIRTIWIIEHEKTTPRFVTLYPL